MSDYTTVHANALSAVQGAGASVTFTHTSPGAYDDATDTYSTPTTSTVTGSAVQVAGDPDAYDRLSLIRSVAPSLFFTPDTLGALPAPGDSASWGSDTYVVKDVQALSPNGTAIAATVVIAK